MALTYALAGVAAFLIALPVYFVGVCGLWEHYHGCSRCGRRPLPWHAFAHTDFCDDCEAWFWRGLRRMGVSA